MHCQSRKEIEREREHTVGLSSDGWLKDVHVERINKAILSPQKKSNSIVKTFGGAASTLNLSIG